MWIVVMLALLSTTTTCSGQYAVLLTVRAADTGYRVELFDLRVKSLDTGKVILERFDEKVDPSDSGRDISVPGQELKIAVQLAESGKYLVFIHGRRGAGGVGGQFALKEYEVDEVVHDSLTLEVIVGDQDNDGFPACGSKISCPPNSCVYLDCDDEDAKVHPFAEERCGNNKDDDCSAGCDAKDGAGDLACEDADGDGVKEDEDCDDRDPCRSPMIPEARNTCAQAGQWDSIWTKACREKLSAEGASFTPPLCGDGVDQDCDDQDPTCFVDQDCDGFAPPGDCDDEDPEINTAATEKCDGRDNNCNNAKDEGCAPCDVDGDLHATPDNDDPNCTLPKDDPDDYDSSIHPQITEGEGGQEGGTALTALREFCSSGLDKDGVKKHRDVDHDGDGKPAHSDGCPSTNCDQDGDGFEGSQCSPPASRLDCKDDDAKIFPGAPDRCGDGVLQNCLADQACSCDADGDGYCPPPQPNPEGLLGDCDDKDKEVYPWAVERCDKKDNDCDGLVDEGNPDSQGNPIPTNKALCNDDNDGECAPPTKPLSGVCACSSLTPNSTRQDDNRVVCAGEDLSLPASPRCFDALQPSLEVCDDTDNNCDGKPYVKGEHFQGKGMVCGVDTGECVAGMVIECDLEQTMDPQAVQVLQAKGTFNEHWVCSTETRHPQKELCNGKDDDCDGFKSKPPGTDLGSAELDEQDADGDGYLACSCPGLLPSPLKGCNDCNDNSPWIHPNALEKCNGVDDNCDRGTQDDGEDECVAGPCQQPVCNGTCSTQQLPEGAACPGGLCLQNSCCTGCWNGKTCLPGTNQKNCGNSGQDCSNCGSGQCVNQTCT